MSLFAAFYRLHNRKAKAVTQMLKDNDYLTKLRIVSSDESQNERSLLGTSKIVYRGVFIRCVSRYRDDNEELDQLLEDIVTNERAVVEYMKSRIWNYDEIMREEIDRFTKKASGIMSSIGQ